MSFPPLQEITCRDIVVESMALPQRTEVMQCTAMTRSEVEPKQLGQRSSRRAAMSSRPCVQNACSSGARACGQTKVIRGESGFGMALTHLNRVSEADEGGAARHAGLMLMDRIVKGNGKGKAPAAVCACLGPCLISCHV